MDNQMIKGKQSILNQNGETFGFSSEAYQAFVTSYSELTRAMAHNDYNWVSLFNLVREQIGKQSFYKLLNDGLRLTASEISDLNRKLAAYQQVPSQVVWNIIGYRGIQKMMSMPVDARNMLMQKISNAGDNLTLKEFYTLYGKSSKKNEQKSEKNQKNEQKGSYKDRKNDRKSWKGEKNEKNEKNRDDLITISRSELERIVRRSVETVMAPSKNNKRNESQKPKKARTSMLNSFTIHPMIV